MKHLRKFESLSDYNSATIVPPAVSLIEEDYSLVYDEKHAIDYGVNPVLMNLMYSWGFAASSKYMTEEECAAVDMTTFKNTIASNLPEEGTTFTFHEFKYFTHAISSSTLMADGLVSINYLNPYVTEWEYPETLDATYNGSDVRVSPVMGIATKIIVNDSVTRYTFNNFNNNDYIEELDFGTAVSEIGGTAFAYCDNLTKIIFRGSTPPDLQYGFLSGRFSTNIKIYVPNDYVNTYKAAGDFTAAADYIFSIDDMP